MSMQSPTGHAEHPAVAFARKLLTARKGPPTEADGPVRRSEKGVVIPGQLTIDDVLELEDDLEAEGAA